jgi:excisionase family DNA binding protein
MKNLQTYQTYVSTSQAAKKLGLSVGTVQRMVQNGVFKAFVTHGGHRRILSESLNDYCKGQGFLPHTTPATAGLLCVLHDSAHLSQALSTLAHWKDVTVMTHPLDLMEIAQDVRVFFIDARIPWLHTSTVHLQNARMQHVHIVLYNSPSLPTDSPMTQVEHLSLFEGDISTDLVCGYLLCTQHAQETLTPQH